MNEEEDSDAFEAFFEEQRLAVPESFISTDGAKGDDEARLLVTDPSTMERSDHFLLTVPEAFRSGVPHAVEKLGLFAAAAGSGEGDEEDFPEDESEFRVQMMEGIWKRADMVRRAPKPN